MRLNITAFSLTTAILWAGAVLLVGLGNMIWPGYGRAFLELVASVYPGYDVTGTFGEAAVGAFYALVDGFVAGLIFAWLYNLLAGRSAVSSAAQ